MMKPRAGILAEIIILLALAPAVPAKAEGIFSLQIGYNNYPYYGGYYNDWPDYFGYGYWPSFYSPLLIGNYFPYYYFFYPSYYYSYYRPVYPYSHAYWCSPWYYCPNYGHYRYDRYGHNHHHDRDRKSHDHDYYRDRHHSYDRHASREPYRNYDQYRQQRSFRQEPSATGRNRPYRSITDERRTPVTIYRNSQSAGREAGNPGFNYSGRDKADVRRGDKNVNSLSRQQSRQAPVVSSPSARGTTRVLSSTRHTARPSYTVPARKRNSTVVRPATPDRGPAYVRQSPSPQSFVGKQPGNRPSSYGRTVKKAAPSHHQRQQQLAQSDRRTDYAQAQSSPRQYRGRDHRQATAGDSGKGSRRTQKQRDSRE